MAFDFEKALRRKIDQHTSLVERKNHKVKDGNGVFDRWENPVLTAAHTPLFWRYDLDPRRTPSCRRGWGSTASSTPAPSSGTARSAWWPASRATTARASSRWPRATTASTASASGTTRW